MCLLFFIVIVAWLVESTSLLPFGEQQQERGERGGGRQDMLTARKGFSVTFSFVVVAVPNK